MADSASSMIRELQKARRDLYRSVRDALVEEGEAIMKRSNEEFAPKDKGDLIAESGVSVIESGESLDELEVILHYGGEKSGAYVLATHETPSGYDPPTWEGQEIKFTKGGPKYLERPLMEAEQGMIDRIAGKVKL